LGTGNSALRLALGPVGLNAELRHKQTKLIDKIHIQLFFNLYFLQNFTCKTKVFPYLKKMLLSIEGTLPSLK